MFWHDYHLQWKTPRRRGFFRQCAIYLVSSEFRTNSEGSAFFRLSAHKSIVDQSGWNQADVPSKICVEKSEASTDNYGDNPAPVDAGVGTLRIIQRINIQFLFADEIIIRDYNREYRSQERE